MQKWLHRSGNWYGCVSMAAHWIISHPCWQREPKNSVALTWCSCFLTWNTWRIYASFTQMYLPGNSVIWILSVPVAACYCKNHLVREFEAKLEHRKKRGCFQLSSSNRKPRKANKEYLCQNVGCLLELFYLIHQIRWSFVYDSRK